MTQQLHSQKNENLHPHKNLNMNVHRSFIHNGQIGNNQNVLQQVTKLWYIHTIEHYSVMKKMSY